MGEKRVRKAVIPAAGLGTRFLPATKAVPKEMMPVVDRPAIQWGVEELAAAGIEQIVLINGRGKVALSDHFDHAYELEDVLGRRGKKAALEAVRRVVDLVEVIEVRQHQPLGLGHAVLCARAAIGDEPFAVLLPDDLFLADVPPTAQLLESFEARGAGVIGLFEVPLADTAKYGVIKGEEVEPGLYRISELVEKPAPEVAPSRLAIPGRYVLPSRIFDYLAETPPGVGGEIQLTDGLARLAREDGLYGRVVVGQRYDTGQPLGLIQATVAFGLRDPEVGPALRAFLNGLVQG